MSGRITYIPKRIHPCEPPTPAADLPLGAIWECGHCGDEWMMIPPASLDAIEPSPEWWVRDPGITESGYRPFRWPWQRRKGWTG